MSTRPTVKLQLVSAPPPPRTCDFCGGKLSAIELWHNCPARRLAFGLHRLRMDAMAEAERRRKARR